MLEKIKNSWLAILLNIIFGFIFITYILFVYEFHIYNTKEIKKLEQFKYEIDSLGLTKSDIQFIDTQNEIKLLKQHIEIVQSSIDNRFDTLGWSFSILCTFITIILILNIVNSKASLKDRIRDELEKIDKERNKKNNAIIDKLNVVITQYQTEIDNFKKSRDE